MTADARTVRARGRLRSATVLLSLATAPGLAAQSLTLEPGKSVEIRCQTQATQVAPDAKVSAGAFRVRFSAVPDAPEGAAGNWTPLERNDAHSSSFAQRHGEACKSGCPLYVGPESKGFELWFPRRATLDKMAPSEMLTIAVIDATTLKLKASTFLDNGVASLEQGDCSRLP